MRAFVFALIPIAFAFVVAQETYRHRIKPKLLFIAFDALDFEPKQIERLSQYTADVVLKTIDVTEGRNTIQHFVVQLVDHKGKFHDATKPLSDEDAAKELVEELKSRFSEVRSHKMIS